MREIIDSQEIHQLKQVMRQIVELPWQLRLDWLSSHHWAAVPVENGAHLLPPGIEWLIRGVHSMGEEECYAVLTEELLPKEFLPEKLRTEEFKAHCCYLIPMQEEALEEFNREFHNINIILLSKSIQFAVLCTSEDYNLIAGPIKFVEAVAGMSIKIARRMFLDYYADDPNWQKITRDRLIGIAKLYEPFNGNNEGN